MSSLRERFCTARGCRPEHFVRAVFWQCLHRHAVPLALLCCVLRPDYFAADRELIANAGRARSLREVNDEIHDFVLDARNHGWWRRRANVRLSTQRLRRLARAHFAAGRHA